MRNCSVLLVDDHPAFRQGLRTIIENVPEFSVVAEAHSVEEGLHQFAVHSPDIVITDLRLGEEHGQTLIEAILKTHPNTPILAVSMFNDSRNVIKTIEAGAKGYLTKGASREEIIAALKEVAQGRNYLHPEIAGLLFHRVRQPAKEEALDLTPRETQTLQHICSGLTPAQAAGAMHLSTSTIKTYLRSLFTKLQVANRTQLVLKAIELGLVETNSRDTLPKSR